MPSPHRLRAEGGNMYATLYERAKAAALEMDSHDSDLYLKDTPEARRIVKEWQEASGLDGAITYFRSDGAQWMDIPFMFDPSWPKGSGAKYRHASTVHKAKA